MKKLASHVANLEEMLVGLQLIKDHPDIKDYIDRLREEAPLYEYRETDWVQKERENREFELDSLSGDQLLKESDRIQADIDSLIEETGISDPEWVFQRFDVNDYKNYLKFKDFRGIIKEYYDNKVNEKERLGVQRHTLRLKRLQWRFLYMNVKEKGVYLNDFFGFLESIHAHVVSGSSREVAHYSIASSIPSLFPELEWGDGDRFYEKGKLSYNPFYSMWELDGGAPKTKRLLQGLEEYSAALQSAIYLEGILAKIDAPYGENWLHQESKIAKVTFGSFEELRMEHQFGYDVGFMESDSPIKDLIQRAFFHFPGIDHI